MNNLFKMFLLVGLVAISGCGKRQGAYNTENFRKYFGENNGCFVLYDVNNRYYIRYNDELCNKKTDSLSANETVELMKENRYVQNDFNFESENSGSRLKGKSEKIMSENTAYETFKGIVKMQNETYYFSIAVELKDTSENKAKDICIKILNSLKIH